MMKRSFQKTWFMVLFSETDQIYNFKFSQFFMFSDIWETRVANFKEYNNCWACIHSSILGYIGPVLLVQDSTLWSFASIISVFFVEQAAYTWRHYQYCAQNIWERWHSKGWGGKHSEHVSKSRYAWFYVLLNDACVIIYDDF